MKVGEIVRVVQIPEGLQDEQDFPTKTVFEICLGKTFPIMGIENNMIELHVGELRGKASYLETIYIEPEFVEIVETSN
jgi:hypothetical protein